jgi:hypothetical protein
MLDRESCERRVYRLATLLTGDPHAATRVIGQVIDVQPDLSRLDGPHMDRLTVLRSREIASRPLRSDVVPAAIAEAIARLPPQQREAWVFSRVYQLQDRELAKAMDCSVTATRLHLNNAEQTVIRWLGADAAHAADSLLRYSMSLEVPGIYRVLRDRKRRFRKAIRIVGIASFVLAILTVIAWLSSHFQNGWQSNKPSISQERTTSDE